MEEAFNSYRDIIRFEFQLRHKKNPSYSMSAFSRDLGVAPSRLSEILSGKQGLSRSRAKVIGGRIGYKGKKLDWFCDLVDAESARSTLIKEQARRRLKDTKNGVISREVKSDMTIALKWYHLAIRRILSMEGFENTTSWIAEKIGVSLDKVEKALDELISLGLVRYTSKKHYERVENIHFPPRIFNRKSRSLFLKSLLWKAYQARDNPIDSRHHGVHIFTVDSEQLEELKSILQECEDKIDNLTYKSKRHDRLMVFMDILYDLTDQGSKT